jgi:hypothetical protein
MRFLALRDASVFVFCILGTGCGSVAALPEGDAGSGAGDSGSPSAHDAGPSAHDSGSVAPDAGPPIPDAGPSVDDSGVPAVDGSTGSDGSVATFRCGGSSGPLCDTATEYCLLQYSGGPAMLPACKPIPAGCNGTPSCACASPSVPDAGSADTVMCMDDDGEITVSEGCLPCQ